MDYQKQENEMAFENDNYIYKLIEKMNDIQDAELLSLIKRLIDERNQLSKIANIDTLTGLNNRRILSEIKKVTGVLMIDIDNFKSINDTYGHDAGDYAIKEVAQVIKNTTRSSDYVCRYGGDEFMIAFVDCPAQVVKERAEKICQEVRDNVKIQGREITISIGAVMNSDLDANLEDLITKADSALYESKKNGKAQVSEFVDEKKELNINR